MKIEQWDIDRLIPYDNNPRKNDDAVEYVANSIREFGFQQPIVVDSEGVIIVGHTRLKAAQKLGLETVPVAVADDLTPNQIDAYRLADNKTNEFAEWDFEKLNEELESIDWLDVDMSEFGFFLDHDGGAGDDLYDDYSDCIGTVVYEPKETKHDPSDLYDFDKKRFEKIIDGIENDDLREMLNLRAAWFAEFDFAKIADYYAYQATKDEQEVFEALGLVLLDRDKLIENGFSNLMDMVISGDDDGE